jgi:hypothetical protein
MDAPKKPTERSKPRISVNKLAEYLTAAPARRRAIVKEQKYPPTFRAIWYDAACTAIVGFLCAEEPDEEKLVAEIERLNTKKPANESEEAKLRTNAEAIEAFLYGYDQLAVEDFKAKPGTNDAAKVIISEVEVSVRPDVMLSGTVRGKTVGGAIKLYFSKETKLTDESAPYISALVHKFVLDKAKVEPSRRHCQVLDVFGKWVEEAPASTKTRMKDIEAACEEIRLLWGVV